MRQRGGRCRAPAARWRATSSSNAPHALGVGHIALQPDDLGADGLEGAHRRRGHIRAAADERDVSGTLLGQPAGDDEAEPAEAAGDQVGGIAAQAQRRRRSAARPRRAGTPGAGRGALRPGPRRRRPRRRASRLSASVAAIALRQIDQAAPPPRLFEGEDAADTPQRRLPSADGAGSPSTDWAPCVTSQARPASGARAGPPDDASARPPSARRSGRVRRESRRRRPRRRSRARRDRPTHRPPAVTRRRRCPARQITASPRACKRRCSSATTASGPPTRFQRRARRGARATISAC